MRWVVLLVALSACGVAPSVPRGSIEPSAVTLYRDTVVVEMATGDICTGVREAPSGPWATTLKGCRYPWPVSVLRPTIRPRLPLAPGAADPWVTLSPPDMPALAFGPRAGT